MDAEFEAEVMAENGNVRVAFTFPGERISFLASPSKIRSLGDIMIRIAGEAESHMPDFGDVKPDA